MVEDVWAEESGIRASIECWGNGVKLRIYGMDPDASLTASIAAYRWKRMLDAVGARWQPIETAPKDGSAILGYGRHTGSPPDAQRGVVAGDHWWAIMLWDVWRESGLAQSSRWVFAKDGARTWSDPTHWMLIPDPPPNPEAKHVA